MAKDALGHGSESRGMSGPSNESLGRSFWKGSQQPSALSLKAPWTDYARPDPNAAARAALAQGNPKSTTPPVHGGARGVGNQIKMAAQNMLSGFRKPGIV